LEESYSVRYYFDSSSELHISKKYLVNVVFSERLISGRRTRKS
jgi:hypothetical protein